MIVHSFEGGLLLGFFIGAGTLAFLLTVIGWWRRG